MSQSPVKGKGDLNGCRGQQVQFTGAPARHDRPGRQRPAHHSRLSAQDKAPRQALAHELAAHCTASSAKQLCYSILTDAQKHKFEEENELDLSFGVKGLSRFRGNLFMQRGAVAGAFRSIPFKPSGHSRSSGFRRSWKTSQRSRAGWSWSPGPTGSGKSTTLASIIDKINTERPSTSSPSRTRSSTCTPQELRS